MVAQESHKPSAVFIVYWPITARHKKVYGFEILRRHGIKVEVLDISLLINGKVVSKFPVRDELDEEFILKIYSFKQLNEYVKQNSMQSVFIDCLMGTSDIDLKTAKVFRFLKKYDAKYYIISAGAVPIAGLPDKNLGFKKITKIFKKLNLYKLHNFAGKRLISALRKRRLFYPIPYKVFGGNSESFKTFIEKYKIDYERVIKVNSWDYDEYIEYIGMAGDDPFPLNKTCVFLDDGIASHPDFDILGMKHVDQDKYFLSMRKLFDKIEEFTGLKVVVSLHPRSNYENPQELFGFREVFKGNTAELVSKSSLVISHFSTSVNFAVLFRKPVLFIKNKELTLNGFADSVDIMAQALDMPIVNVDETEEFYIIVRHYHKWSLNNYDEYKSKYIYSPRVLHLKVWEIVVQELKKDLLFVKTREC